MVISDSLQLHVRIDLRAHLHCTRLQTVTYSHEHWKSLTMRVLPDQAQVSSQNLPLSTYPHVLMVKL